MTYRRVALQTDKNDPSKQVIVVGGGMAGITLALAFEQLHIKYALIEAHDNLVPNLGASVGLQPNGLRVLDQIGLLNQIEKHTIPLNYLRHLGADGELISEVNALSHFLSRYVRNVVIEFWLTN